jgi:hypothetical protein
MNMLNVTRRTTTCRYSIAYIYCVQQYIPVQQYTYICVPVVLRPIYPSKRKSLIISQRGLRTQQCVPLIFCQTNKIRDSAVSRSPAYQQTPSHPNSS